MIRHNGYIAISVLGVRVRDPNRALSESGSVLLVGTSKQLSGAADRYEPVLVLGVESHTLLPSPVGKRLTGVGSLGLGILLVACGLYMSDKIESRI
jgi:hypothetical protein